MYRQLLTPESDNKNSASIVPYLYELQNADSEIPRD